MLRKHGDAVEADLQRWYHIDYRDRWRFDADGNRKLTVRRIGVLIRHLPADSATFIALGGSGWTLDHYLTASMWQAFTGKLHPAFPTSSKKRKEDPSRAQLIEAAKVRRDERQRKIDAQEIT